MRIFLFLSFFPFILLAAPVEVGADRLFESGYAPLVKNKRLGLVTNHTGIGKEHISTIDILRKKGNLVAIFTPEHGLTGAARAYEKVPSGSKGEIKVFSLHGETRRPTKEMLTGIDVLLYDIQEIGCRSYTYISTLFYVMEEAAKEKIPVVVLDRPNPMGGEVVDGPMLEEKWRSFIGYADIPYCHGMTVGELARFFNEEYKVGCTLRVVPMSGWRRAMSFSDTGLAWIPTSPYIPESDTPFYYASTGILGGLGVVNIGIGYTLPFKVVGAPWIDGPEFASKLNAQKLPGVKFLPFSYKPFYGKFQGKECEGVQILITDRVAYRPLAVQYMLIGMLKSLYPVEFRSSIATLSESQIASFCKVNGTSVVFDMINKEKYVAWKLIEYDSAKRAGFLEKRKKYLLYD